MSKRILFGLAAVAFLAATTGATPASARGTEAEPLDIVHTELTTVGPYQVRTSFTRWPLRSERSLDFLFETEQGITGLKATLKPVAPDGEVLRPQQQSTADGTELARHPRALDQWGFDIVALNQPGIWRFEFTLDGPDGPGTGVLEVPVGSRPGPPGALAWAVGLLPLAAVVPLGGYLWWRTRPGRRRDTWQWT